MLPQNVPRLRIGWWAIEQATSRSRRPSVPPIGMLSSRVPHRRTNTQRPSSTAGSKVRQRG